ncbi:NlpC/P60 family protein [Clostridioides difficile]|nr:NlpC/P60 family protein [Clostridioides difficile]MCA0633930.1 C40 family peptidase [Clostridioides difficile]MCK8751545.1 NlpC/P60 family protein [Clostridioides difficile]MDI2798427.1 NlpC/P60 family protein [Clostridioides difficile]MDL0354490.1 NlpC/P60 family protein [Clostridioides difficile]HBF2436941.1 C40 family peptidase [Clostridioides difficile]
MIINRSKDSSSNEISFVSKDMGFLLTQSEVSYNFKDKLVEDITKQVFAENRLSVGTIAKTNVKYTKMFIGVNGYDTIMSAYTEASKKTKKKYMIEANLDKFNVIEKGTVTLNVMFEEGFNIINTTFSESMENVKNKVIVVDQYGSKISEKIDNEIFKEVNVIMQKVIQQQENQDVDIDSEFNGIEKSCSLKGYGDVSCITGRGVKVKDSYTKLVGLFYIDTDKHTWQNGEYQIELELNFQNLMDEKSAGQDEPKEESNLGGEDYAGGKEFTAEFTAYCPRKEEGGDTDCRKKKLDPSKKTCAAPMVGKYEQTYYTKEFLNKHPLLNYGDEIQVITGVSGRDGVYKVNDVGPAITIEKNGTYHIDILFGNVEEASKFGRRKGKIIIGGYSGNVSDKAKIVISEAKKHLGKPYKWGGNGPSSFDCSGLMVYCFKKVNVSLPRTSNQQSKKGKKVEQKNLQAGDLVFFHNPVSHVGLYIGNGEFLHAPQKGDVVKISKLSSRRDFNTARRVL